MARPHGRLRREPVSVVCVFNDADVLRDCLARSVETLRPEAPETELVAVDNTTGRYPTAGAALTHGASRARHDYLVFAHQDVYLHSLAALETAAGRLADEEGIGMIGSAGMSADGRVLGRMRDRVMLLGEPLREPTDVDSLDEVLFMIPRAVLDRFPLATRPELAWHAYAVEYGLRLRSKGLRVAAGDLPITHNSLTTNLDRLDVAHRAVGDAYPHLLPVRTTCGVIRPARRELPGGELLRPLRWRYQWLRESLATRRARSALVGAPFVLSDITIAIDDVLAATEPITILNHAGDSAFADERLAPLALTRAGKHLTVQSARTAQLADKVAARSRAESMLITNLGPADLPEISPALGPHRIVGFYRGHYWVIAGPAALSPPAQWASQRARPLPLPAFAG